MRKLVKKYEEFVYGNTEREKTERPGETTTTPVREPGTPTRPMPTRRETYVPTETPSVNPDPLAVLKDELEGSKLEGNILYYKDYEIEYPSETNSYVVNGKNVGKDYQAVIDYIVKTDSYYDAEYEKPELSDVTVGEDGKLNNFDAEYEALKGKTHLKESKSYKDTRNFKKRK